MTAAVPVAVFVVVMLITRVVVLIIIHRQNRGIIAISVVEPVGSIKCIGRVMCHMVKVTKSLRIPVDVAEALEEQDNQSATTEKALREYLGVPADE